MKIFGRSKLLRRVHSVAGTAKDFSAFILASGTPPHALGGHVRTSTHFPLRPLHTRPTHSGWCCWPLFHIPHNVAARVRATFRPALWWGNPASLPRTYCAANGLSRSPVADCAALRIIHFSRRLTHLGTRTCTGPLPLRRGLAADVCLNFMGRRCANDQMGKLGGQGLSAALQPRLGFCTRCSGDWKMGKLLLRS